MVCNSIVRFSNAIFLISQQIHILLLVVGIVSSRRFIALRFRLDKFWICDLSLALIKDNNFMHSKYVQSYSTSECCYLCMTFKAFMYLCIYNLIPTYLFILCKYLKISFTKCVPLFRLSELVQVVAYRSSSRNLQYIKNSQHLALSVRELHLCLCKRVGSRPAAE